MIRVTRKTLLTLGLGILTTAVLALGSVALIGSRVGSEIERYRGVLISRDDISVVQFDYDSHFWGGELRYRLVWRPERSAGTLAQLLQTLDLPEERRNVAGRIDIRHGPWLGGVSFGLARADLDVAVPAALRQAFHIALGIIAERQARMRQDIDIVFQPIGDAEIPHGRCNQIAVK